MSGLENFKNTGDTCTRVLFLVQCTYGCCISNCTVVNIPCQWGNILWKTDESDEKKANSALLLPSTFPFTRSPAPAIGGPRLHRSVPLHVNSKFASRNFAKPNRTVFKNLYTSTVRDDIRQDSIRPGEHPTGGCYFISHSKPLIYIVSLKLLYFFCSIYIPCKLCRTTRLTAVCNMC